jgi:hypothetical protein
LDALVSRILSKNVEILIMDSQLYEEVGKSAQYIAFQDASFEIALKYSVGYIPRYQMMKRMTEGKDFNLKDLLNPDTLHMNDVMYTCVSDFITAVLQ